MRSGSAWTQSSTTPRYLLKRTGDLFWESRCFALFFTIELVLRFLATHAKKEVLRDIWFAFDAMILLPMIFETWIMPLFFALFEESFGNQLEKTSSLRVLRLLRLARITKMARIVPEMLFMVKGLLEASRTVSVTMVLLFGVLYVCGITLRELSMGTEMGEEYFPSVQRAIYTLFFAGALLDNITEVMDDVARESTICAIVLCIVIALASLTLLNMLIGVLCEVVGCVAEKEKEVLIKDFVREKVLTVMIEQDEDFDGLISQTEFRKILENPHALFAIHEVGVDPDNLVDYADMIFQSDSEGKAFENKLDLESFMNIILKLRDTESGQVVVKDIVELKKWLHAESTERHMAIGSLKFRQRRIEVEVSKTRCAVDDMRTRIDQVLLTPQGGAVAD